MARSSSAALSCVCVVHERVFSSFNNFAGAAASTAAFIQLIRECSMRIYNSCSVQLNSLLHTALFRALCSILPFWPAFCLHRTSFDISYSFMVVAAAASSTFYRYIALPSYIYPSIIFNSLIILLFIFFQFHFILFYSTYREVNSVSILLLFIL